MAADGARRRRPRTAGDRTTGLGLGEQRPPDHRADRRGSAVRSARERVRALIGDQHLAQIANWPDFIRSEPGWKFLDSWHYATVEDGEDFAEVLARDAKTPTPDEVVEAIEFFASILRGDGAKVQLFRDLMAKNGVEPLAGSLEATALSFVVHLVGDVHQPLHVGRGRPGGQQRRGRLVRRAEQPALALGLGTDRPRELSSPSTPTSSSASWGRRRGSGGGASRRTGRRSRSGRAVRSTRSGSGRAARTSCPTSAGTTPRQHRAGQPPLFQGGVRLAELLDSISAAPRPPGTRRAPGDRRVEMPRRSLRSSSDRNLRERQEHRRRPHRAASGVGPGERRRDRPRRFGKDRERSGPTNTEPARGREAELLESVRRPSRPGGAWWWTRPSTSCRPRRSRVTGRCSTRSASRGGSPSVSTPGGRDRPRRRAARRLAGGGPGSHAARQVHRAGLSSGVLPRHLGRGAGDDDATGARAERQLAPEAGVVTPGGLRDRPPADSRHSSTRPARRRRSRWATIWRSARGQAFSGASS